MVSFDHHPQAHQSPKQTYPFGTKSKTPQLTLSDDEDTAAGEDSGGDGKRKISPWQRMKWTDSMVRLLIMVVFYIGDEVGSEGNDPAAGKKKSGAGGVLQKKGKWKSVSRAMMERGFYVSPQQCEDKFNDLNKRYKRVNDILGKGTACKVVENQSLLDTMDHLSPKVKDEVKKLLNSKHLFFREMCAYHNSCGNGSGSAGAGGHHSPEVAQAEGSQNQQQRCLHSSENIQIANNNNNLGIISRAETEGSKSVKELSDDDEDENEDEDDEYDEEEVVEGGRAKGHEQDEDEGNTVERGRKRARNLPLIQQFSGELTSVVQDLGKSAWEKRQWMRNRLMQLEEQRVGYHCQAFEIEKQRLKWLKFSSKKEREMEVEKLANERLRLENERMVLLLRQKEMELVDFQQPGNKRGDPPSSVTG
ncbi:hypothetical protein LguiA_016026 [Lonicera macranthoides]